MLENASMRRAVVKLLRDWHAISVENGHCHPGTPDVNYAHGWLELKALEHWPVREDTVVRVDHFTPQQRIWLIRRSRCGGRVHLLMTVGHDWLLFDARVAAKHLGHSTKAELYEIARKTWAGTPNPEELKTCLLEN